MSVTLEIIEFEPILQKYFEALNVAWLEKYFKVEPIDRLVLQNPQEQIIDHGGYILFGRYQDQVVATCALKFQGGGKYELTKMAVDESCQGKGFGRVLLEATIAKFKQTDGNYLYLESHHSLGPALRLYETGGFVHTPRPEPSVYQRSDIYMVYQGPGSSSA